MSSVLLLREASGTSDAYREALEQAGYAVRNTPVLTFRFTDVALMADALRRPSAFGGLIVTSPRGAEALCRVKEHFPEMLEAWSSSPVYAIGPFTARGIRSVHLKPKGSESGNGIALANEILAQPPTKPLLFICGKPHRPELPEMLAGRGVSIEKLIAYESMPVKPITWPEAEEPSWVVGFSPAGIQNARAQWPVSWLQSRLAAIGPTTASAIQRAFECRLEAVAATPSPEALKVALQDADRLPA